MKNIAIIDIGSNSVKIILAEVKDNNSFEIIGGLKETIRLGEGLNKDNNLEDGRIDKLVQTLKRFKELSDYNKTEKIIAVATAAIRKATNQESLLDKVRKETGIDIKVLSGEEEAHYAYLAVSNSIKERDGLIMDIGGGSIELILMKDKRVEKSIKIGQENSIQTTYWVAVNWPEHLGIKYTKMF